jgi:cell division septation protein DedD
MASAEESELQPPPIQRRIFLSFCATVVAGVLLFGAYLSVRTAGSPISRRNRPAEVPPPRATPAPAASVIQPRALIVPRPEQPIHGKTYLQLAALDRERAEVFVETLARNGFRAVLAGGPTEGIYRILVGPFDDAAALAGAQAELQALGFSSFPRKHPAQ